MSSITGFCLLEYLCLTPRIFSYYYHDYCFRNSLPVPVSFLNLLLWERNASLVCPCFTPVLQEYTSIKSRTFSIVPSMQPGNNQEISIPPFWTALTFTGLRGVTLLLPMVNFQVVYLPVLKAHVLGPWEEAKERRQNPFQPERHGFETVFFFFFLFHLVWWQCSLTRREHILSSF